MPKLSHPPWRRDSSTTASEEPGAVHFDRTMLGTYEPQIILSPVGSKVLAAGALMAAIEHGMTVQYLETRSYTFEENPEASGALPDMTVHVLLSGPAYAGYTATGRNRDETGK